ncbi:glycosyltransferase family 2 protein [Clostridium perfringens]|uniref:glycosyltransferase family 2 protein n=1 Tax=Clostridium perfringens TaxID=1502 RepID=UPI001C866E81|nr:glycosyltransferase family 2 protein [Clostridium perfringens]MDM0692000.1 glycosyltransferase family 2 protein [Clostridium perfringens]
MKETPLFSVVVPIYKIEKYLDQCINSIINQTFSNIEIILVDDGSPDHCPDICEKYKRMDNRIKVIHKENGGLVSARQAGAEISCGKYIACIDGDDWIASNYFEEFEKIVRKHNADVISCGSIWSYDDKNINKPIQGPYGYYDRRKIENQIFPMLIEKDDGSYFAPSIWAKVFKREMYQKQQKLVNCSISVGEDHACVKPIIYYANSIVIIEDCLYYYRQNPYSMTKKLKPFSWEGPKMIGMHFEKQIPMREFDFQDQVYRIVVHNLFNVAVSQFNQNKKYHQIKLDINEHIKDPYYQNAIKFCSYRKNSKGSFALKALKYKMIFIMYLYNRLKQLKNT